VNYFYPEGNKLNLPGDTRDLIHHLEQLNTNLRPVGSQRQIQVNGHQALVTMLQSDSPFGGVEQDGLLTVETSEGIFYMMLIAPQNQFKNSRQMFERMISSLQLN
jgi:hypothetical protein